MAYPALCCKGMQTSPQIRALPCGTLFRTRNIFFAFSSWQVDRRKCCQLSRPTIIASLSITLIVYLCIQYVGRDTVSPTAETCLNCTKTKINNPDLNSGNGVLCRTVGPVDRLYRYDVLHPILFIAL